MGHERNPAVTAELPQPLGDLGQMAVALHAIGREVLVHRDEVKAIANDAARARHAGGGADHHVADEPLAGQWCERQERGGRIAARVGDEPGAANVVAVELGEPVHRVAEELGSAMLAVGRLIGRLVMQPEIGRDVHDLLPRLHQPRHHPRGGAMRVGDDGRVGLGRVVWVEQGQLDGHAVARVEPIQTLPCVRARGRRRELQPRMPVNEVRRERSGESRCARDDDAGIRHGGFLRSPRGPTRWRCGARRPPRR